MKWKLPLLPITLVLSGSIALGQTSDAPSARRITLHEAVQLALQHNHCLAKTPSGFKINKIRQVYVTLSHRS